MPSSADQSDIHITIDLGYRDVGSLRLERRELANVLVDEYQRHLGWYGRPDAAEDKRRKAETIKQRDAATRIVDSWERSAGDDVGRALNVLLLGELAARLMQPADLLDKLEREIQAERYAVFAAPTVQRVLSSMRENRSLPKQQKLQIKRIAACVGRLAEGRRTIPLEERADVQLLRRRQAGETTAQLAKDRKQKPAAIRAMFSSAKKEIERARLSGATQSSP